MSLRPARLCLADGSLFEGALVEGTLKGEAASGEVVFTTGMTGYQEVLTDPSYRGQIVVMTAPQIGNTGTNSADPESRSGTPHVAGFVVREASDTASSWRATESLGDHLRASKVPMLTGIDTRRLTRHLRTHGSQNGAIGTLDASSLVDIARAEPDMNGRDLVKDVSASAAYPFEEGTDTQFRLRANPLRGLMHSVGPSWTPSSQLDSVHTVRALAAGSAGTHVVALDLGIKKNILRCFTDLGCKVTVVPATTPAADILALGSDGIFVSNGPGDPAAVTYAISTIRDLLGKKPVFGICLGHQLLALALGAKTYKLKFGHRGLNQPVLDMTTGRIEITSQNHGFAVDVLSLPAAARATHVHLNDGTSEGLEVPEARAFSVQFHPEAAAGPHDTQHLFERFVRMCAPPSVGG